MAHSYVLRHRQLLSDAWQLKAAAGIMYRLWSFTPFRYYTSIAFLICSVLRNKNPALLASIIPRSL